MSAPAALLALAVLRIVLVGDSTVAPRTGWGPGFRLYVTDDTEVVNVAANGRSSKSYRDEGRWADALARKGDYYLIQFGHNDEPGKGAERETDPPTYRANMARYVDEVRAAGAHPVLVTSLTRRTFEDGHVRANIVPYVEAARSVAAEKQVPLLDLHASSLALVERMGALAWDAISYRDATGKIDRTHLGPEGSRLTAALVVDELRRAVPALAPHLRETPLTGALAERRMADAVVAADGTGDHRTVQEAIDALPQDTASEKPWTIFVAAGQYREVVYVQREKRFVRVVGEDPATTVVTYDLHAGRVGLDGRPIGTFRTPTLTIDADDFTVENLTVENSAGPVGQALALRVDGDRVVFRNCRFLGWQDTVFLDRGRQLFEDCLIAGHVDFIFGGATALFERGEIHVRGDGYITAASTPARQAHGFVFRGGRITADPGVKTYLGRPWRGNAATAFVDTWMSDAVRPEGWHDWDKPERRKTVRYAEGGSTGPGVGRARRVDWARALDAAGMAALDRAAVLGGADEWCPKDAKAPTACPRPLP